MMKCRFIYLSFIAVLFLAVSCQEQDPVPLRPVTVDTVTVSRPPIDVVTLADVAGSRVAALAATAYGGTLDGLFRESLLMELSPLATADPASLFPKLCDRTFSGQALLFQTPDADDGLFGGIDPVRFEDGEDMVMLDGGHVDLSGRVPLETDVFTLLNIPMTIRLPDGIAAVNHFILSGDMDVTVSIIDPYFSGGMIHVALNLTGDPFFGCVDGDPLSLHGTLSADGDWSFSSSFRLSELDGAHIHPSSGRDQSLTAHLAVAGTIRTEGLCATREALSAAPTETRLSVSVAFHDVQCISVEGTFDREVDKSLSWDLTPFSALDMSGARLDATVNGDGAAGAALQVQVFSTTVPFAISSPGDISLSVAELAPRALVHNGVLPVTLSASLPLILQSLPVGMPTSLEVSPSLSLPLRLADGFRASFTDTLTLPDDIRKSVAGEPLHIVIRLANTLPCAFRASASALSERATPVATSRTETVPPGGDAILDMDAYAMAQCVIITTEAMGGGTLHVGDALSAEVTCSFRKERQ